MKYVCLIVAFVVTFVPRAYADSPKATVILKDGSTTNFDGNLKMGELAPNQTINIPVKPQAWQVRRTEFAQAVSASIKPLAIDDDIKARKIIDRILTEYERNPDGRTPMEAMDLLGTFYLPREGFKVVMPIIVKEAVLGWVDTLQWASESAKAEIVNNEKFFSRAFLFGSANKNLDSWLGIIEKDPQTAKKLVENGIRVATATVHSTKWEGVYDHKWPTAYGLERMIKAMQGLPENTLITEPRMGQEQALKAAIDKVTAYYLPKKSE